MGSLVKYRDLPGGPTDIEMCEDISRHCLCTQCGMLSMFVLEDHQKHVFCTACVEERSCKMQEYIFCKYEQKNVGLEEMFQANDVLTVIRDQIAICPNKECRKTVSLKELPDHYTQCTPRVQCPVCRQRVQSAEWTTHWKIHFLGGSQQHCSTRANQNESSVKQSPKNAVCQQKEPISSTISSRELPESNSNYCLQFGHESPSGNAQVSPVARSQTSSSSPIPPQRQPIRNNDRPEAKSASNCVVCEYCSRRVKDINLVYHRKTCSKAPKACVYCGRNIWRQDMTAHTKHCQHNPDKVPEATGALADKSSNADRVKRVNNAHETPGLKFKAHGSVSLRRTFPELPTLALSSKEMETWRHALEQHLSMLGIRESRQKYEILVSTLPPEIMRKVDDTATKFPLGREYDILLEVLFKLRESTMKTGSNQQTDDGSDDILVKHGEKPQPGNNLPMWRF